MQARALGRKLAPVFGALAAACAAAGGCAGAEPGGGSAASTRGPVAAAPAGERGASVAPQVTGAGASARVLARVEEAPHGLALTVENHGPGEARLAPAVRVEVVRGGQAARAPDLLLRDACGRPLPAACRSLARGAALRPPVWLDGQCEQPVLGASPEGTYRFTVTDCDGEVVAAVSSTHGNDAWAGTPAGTVP